MENTWVWKPARVSSTNPVLYLFACASLLVSALNNHVET
jgi:hypothetical protein